jgi:hypothetical protein
MYEELHVQSFMTDRLTYVTEGQSEKEMSNQEMGDINKTYSLRQQPVF